jgi:Fe-S oxidoreductase
MAGTFGYEVEHYEVSLKVGELKLFPKIRESTINRREIIPQKSEIENPRSKVASSGAACRIQIRQGTGVDAIHPIVLIADLVKKAANHDERS